jgi:hypothetical protein
MEKNNKLIAEFMGAKVDFNVVDWSDFNNKSLTEHWNNNNKTFVYTPKGSGFAWYKVKHRNQFYQLFTDFTFNKLKEEELELGCNYNNRYYIINDLKFDSSWDWLMPVIDKIYSSDEYILYKREESGQFDVEVHINTKYIINTWKDVIEFIKWYNKNKKDNDMDTRKRTQFKK